MIKFYISTLDVIVVISHVTIVAGGHGRGGGGLKKFSPE